MEIKANTLTNEESYRLWNIARELSSVLKNLSPETIENIALQEVTEQKKKREMIDKQFQGRKFKTIDQETTFITFPNHPDFQVSQYKGGINILRHIHSKEKSMGIDSPHSTLLTTEDLQTEGPTGIDIKNEEGNLIQAIEITPLTIAEQQIRQIGIGVRGGKKDYFYIRIAETGKELEIIGTDNKYLTGDYNEYMNRHMTGSSLLVKVIPSGGRNRAFRGGERIGFCMYEAPKKEVIDFEELFESA